MQRETECKKEGEISKMKRSRRNVTTVSFSEYIQGWLAKSILPSDYWKISVDNEIKFYWITTVDHNFETVIEQKLARLRYHYVLR